MKRKPVDPGLRAMFEAIAREFATERPRPRWEYWDDAAMALGLVLVVTAIARGWAWAFVIGASLGSVAYGFFAYRAHRSRYAYRKLRRIDRALRRSRKAHHAGRPDRAVPAAEALLALLPEFACPWIYVNEAVCANINAGRYRDPLLIANRWSIDARKEGTRFDPNHWALVEINLAEAEYNLGDVDAAVKRMAELDDALRDVNGAFQEHPEQGIVQAGLMTQRAWMHCLRGEAEPALRALSQVTKDVLPKEYRAEVEFTRAFALATAKRFAEARDAIGVGLREAKRASSRRNGLFLKAMIASWSGALTEACELFEQAAAHKYKAQGGDALLAWGNTLAALGKSSAACAAWRLCGERDPQSDAAIKAKAALAIAPSQARGNAANAQEGAEGTSDQLAP